MVEESETEFYLNRDKAPHKYVIDIDGVIAHKNDGLNYELAKPNHEMIRFFNSLYDEGNEIVYFTARGYKTGIDWEETTREQFKKWGVKYHDLIFGKPDADYYIDDKAINSSVISSIVKDNCFNENT